MNQQKNFKMIAIRNFQHRTQALFKSPLKVDLCGFQVLLLVLNACIFYGYRSRMGSFRMFAQ